MYRIAPAVLAVLAIVASHAAAQSAVWAQLPVATSPDGLALDACYDAARDRVVAIGESGNRVGEHWEFDGSAWLQLSTMNLGSQMAAAYDSTRNRVLVVGNDNSRTFRTFAYSGIWSNLAPANQPSVAAGEVEIVYDTARDRVVLYISRVASTTTIGETWEFDGSDWMLRTHGGPTPRDRVEMAYDPIRGRTVMFGGGPASGAAFAETWEWDGVAWIERLVPAPNLRAYHAMAWHAGLGAVVVYGGSTGAGGDWRDSWAWDGSAWTQVTTSADPGKRLDAGMAYDSLRGHLILAGGHSASGSGTWEWTAHAPVRGTFSGFGTGCAGSAGVPVLVNFQGDLPYVNETFSMRVQHVGTSVLNIPFGVIGSSNTSWQQFSLPMNLAPFGFTGCSGYVSLDDVVPLTSANGRATWDLSIPNVPTLAGGTFYVQALVLDPGATPGGAVVSNAGVGVVGLR